MSGYPLKTSYDATQKRKKYLEELSLRARLDNENLQANKLYKRTGAISTLPDTRTTTEKLADLYRLRIDIRSKLGQLMSGDDAQKVVNRLDAKELEFLVGRIDRYITELKPKYSMGMPYQIFIKFFKDAITNFMAYGDIDLNTAAVFENVARTEDLKYAIDEMVREIQLAGKKELILKIEGLDEFYNLINQAKMILPNVADPTLQQNIEKSLLAIENIPTAIELDDLKNRYEQAVRTGSVVREEEISKELKDKIEAVNKLEAEKEALKQNLEFLKQDVGQQASLKLAGVETYYDDFIPITDRSYYTSGQNGGAVQLFQQIVDVAFKEGSDKKLEFEEWVRGHSPLFDRIRNIMSGKSYVDVLNKIGGIASINKFIQDNKDFFNTFMNTGETYYPDVIVEGPSGSQSITASMMATPSGSQTPIQLPATPMRQATPPPTQQTIQIPRLNSSEFKANVPDQISKPILSQFKAINAPVNDIFRQIYKFDKTQLGQAFPRPIEKFWEYVVGWLEDVAIIADGNFSNINLENFINNEIMLGRGLTGKKPKMKGGSVRIDVNAGMRDDTNVPKYVPFGRYIINRNKLNDGVVMIKRPNGAFMGDLQSRRVSNNLRNVFEKVVGGAIPTYQDFAKLDEDEKQYLHYVSKKANLVDKLQVPTPNKDEEERMINRYEILRGQLVAGNDNKQMIAEFKKLLLDMSDRKLLPRRQVSDILIDIEKMYG